MTHTRYTEAAPHSYKLTNSKLKSSLLERTMESKLSESLLQCHAESKRICDFEPPHAIVVHMATVVTVAPTKLHFVSVYTTSQVRPHMHWRHRHHDHGPSHIADINDPQLSWPETASGHRHTRNTCHADEPKVAR